MFRIEKALQDILKENDNRINKDEQQKLFKQLSLAESYLKTRYEHHCTEDDSCMSHCAKHGLSHTSKNSLVSICEKQHSSQCFDCFNIIDSINSVKTAIESIPDTNFPNKDDFQYRIEEAETAILSWQNHLLRASQQGKGKVEAMEQVEKNTDSAFLVRDFAQKIEPMRGIESQEQYFGKSGMSLHADVFVMKSSTGWCKASYLTVFDKAEQDALDILGITEVVAEEFASNYPHIRYLYLKSDNAGCYHNASVVECMQSMFEKHNITVLRYDFNEPQKGKDVCDREFTNIKQRLRNEVNSNANACIDNGKKLVDAIMADGGPPNTRAIVLEIDKNQAKLENKSKIKNIRSYHSFQYENDGIRLQEYYNIGNGNFESNKGVRYISGVTKKSEWIVSQRQGADMTHRKSNTVYSCSELLCKCSFKTEEELISHEHSGQHDFEKLTKRDQIINLFIAKKYAYIEAKTAHESTPQPDMLKSEQRIMYEEHFARGFARPETKYRRFSKEQTNFVRNLYNEGNKRGSNKKSPEQIANEMHQAFPARECLKPKQIKGLITRFMKENHIENCEEVNFSTILVDIWFLNFINILGQ